MNSPHAATDDARRAHNMKLSAAERVLLAWSGVVLAAAAWNKCCEAKKYDLEKSTPDCLRFRGSTECHDDLPPGCLAPASIAFLSPRWLATFVGYGGPLITWVPLLLAETSERPFANLLRLTLLWYLALIGLVRHTHTFLGVHWDPSGHVFVYGSQLIPQWRRWHAHAGGATAAAWPLLERAVVAWAALLCYLSATTAAFFHLWNETVVAWLVVLLLWALLAADRPEAKGGAAAPGAWLAAASWLLCTAGAWALLLAQPRGAAKLWIRVGEATYDGVLWLLYLALAGR